MDPAYLWFGWNDEDLKKRKPIKEVLQTLSKSKFEDPEGDVFLNLELEGENIGNKNPSLWTVFYVTGIIYLTVIPYFVIYNAAMFMVFMKFVDVLVVKEIALLNSLTYGWIGVQILICLGFLLSIFANNMAVWLAWKKYYRLKASENNKALFFSIFKQRVLYQYIYEYTKDE